MYENYGVNILKDHHYYCHCEYHAAGCETCYCYCCCYCFVIVYILQVVVRLVIYSDQQLMKEWDIAKSEVVFINLVIILTITIKLTVIIIIIVMMVIIITTILINRQKRNVQRLSQQYY